MTAAKDNPTAWNDWQLWNKTEKPDLPDDMVWSLRAETSTSTALAKPLTV